MDTKNIHILIFLSLYFIGMIYSKYNFPKFRCMDDDLEMSDICGIGRDNMIYLGETCRWNQLCSKIESNSPTDYYKCQKIVEKRHEGKRCKTDGDCLSGYCGGGECQLKEKCVNNYSCEKEGYYCTKSNECKDFKKKNEGCELGDVCEAGYGCNYFIPGLSYGKCRKYGSLNDGKPASDGIFCKSGIIDNDGICVSVIQDSECKYKGDNEQYYCSPTVDNGTSYYTIYSECEPYKQNPICKVSKLKSSFFEDYIEKYKKMNTKRIMKKTKFRLSDENSRYFYNKNLLKKYFKYYYFEKLRAIGVMNEDGKIEKDCEFDYYLKHFYETNRSSYIKFLALFSFGLMSLLL